MVLPSQWILRCGFPEAFSTNTNQISERSQVTQFVCRFFASSIAMVESAFCYSGAENSLAGRIVLKGKTTYCTSKTPPQVTLLAATYMATSLIAIYQFCTYTPYVLNALQSVPNISLNDLNPLDRFDWDLLLSGSMTLFTCLFLWNSLPQVYRATWELIATHQQAQNQHTALQTEYTTQIQGLESQIQTLQARVTKLTGEYNSERSEHQATKLNLFEKIDALEDETFALRRRLMPPPAKSAPTHLEIVAEHQKATIRILDDIRLLEISNKDCKDFFKGLSFLQQIPNIVSDKPQDSKWMMVRYKTFVEYVKQHTLQYIQLKKEEKDLRDQIPGLEGQLKQSESLYFQISLRDQIQGLEAQLDASKVADLQIRLKEQIQALEAQLDASQFVDSQISLRTTIQRRKLRLEKLMSRNAQARKESDSISVVDSFLIKIREMYQNMSQSISTISIKKLIDFLQIAQYPIENTEFNPLDQLGSMTVNERFKLLNRSKKLIDLVTQICGENLEKDSNFLDATDGVRLLMLTDSKFFETNLETFSERIRALVIWGFKVGLTNSDHTTDEDKIDEDKMTSVEEYSKKIDQVNGYLEKLAAIESSIRTQHEYCLKWNLALPVIKKNISTLKPYFIEFVAPLLKDYAIPARETEDLGIEQMASTASLRGEPLSSTSQESGILDIFLERFSKKISANQTSEDDIKRVCEEIIDELWSKFETISNYTFNPFVDAKGKRHPLTPEIFSIPEIQAFLNENRDSFMQKLQDAISSDVGGYGVFY